jgi:hypothetical protein
MDGLTTWPLIPETVISLSRVARNREIGARLQFGLQDVAGASNGMD